MALQRPSSVGILPAQQEGLFYFAVHSYTTGTQGTVSYKNMRTGQFVALEIQLTHSTAARKLGWNSTCKIFD